MVTRSAAAVLSGVAVLGIVGLGILAMARLLVPSGLEGDSISNLILTVFAIGLVAEGVAGFAAARLAPSHPFLHAVGVALMLSVIVLLTGFVSPEPYTVAASQAAVNLLQIPGLILGAYVATRRRRA